METLNHVKPTMNESANLNMWVLSKLANETFAISRFLALEQPGKCASKVLQRHREMPGIQNEYRDFSSL